MNEEQKKKKRRNKCKEITEKQKESDVPTGKKI